MASRAPWSADEIVLLKEHVEDSNWYPKVRGQIRGRSEQAVRKRMFKLRSERCGGDRRREHWMTPTEIRRATRELLAATVKVGRWV